MYIIKAVVDGQEYTLHNPRKKRLISGDPYFEIGDNINGQAEFTIYPTHPYYSKVKKLITDIVIYRDDKPEFYGRVLYDDEDFSGTKKVFVEGELAFFCDSIQRPKVYHNMPVRAYLQDLVDNHNSQVEERKQFVLGQVTVTDPNDSLYRYSNWEDTRTILTDKLTSRLGGHLVIRHENGYRYLDYLDDQSYYKRNTQGIRFGRNLLDFAKNTDASEIVTCVIPLGAKLDEEEQDESLEQIKEQRITISDVNGGVDYVTDDNAVREYGKIYHTVIFDGVTVPANLKKKGEEYLKTVQYEKIVLEVKAIDLNMTDESFQSFEVGNLIRCISAPNSLDKEFPLTKKKIYLSSFKKNTITLGDESHNRSYVATNRQDTANMETEIKSLPSKSEILEQARKDAQALINGVSTSGYAIHEPNEFIVADSKDYKNEAKNLWRWGLGGLAHYSEGYNGPIDGVALTMDGKINGKMVLANSILAEALDVGYRKDVEKKISDAQSDAVTDSKNYTDSEAKLLKESTATAIRNTEKMIVLSASSTKEYASRKNYVVKGEQETLDLAAFAVSGVTSAITIQKAEFLNMDCLKITFGAAGTVSVGQLLGVLKDGTYTIAVDAAYPEGKAPQTIAVGFGGNQDVSDMDSYSHSEFRVFKKTVKITTAIKMVSVTVRGELGSVCYLTNIRCLRDIVEMVDNVSASLATEADRITAQVNSKFKDYSTTEETKSMLQVAQNTITSTVAKNQSKYDTTSLPQAVDYYGYGTPKENGIERPTEPGVSKIYLDQATGNWYLGSTVFDWAKMGKAPLVTDKLKSLITQTADSIKSEVSKTYVSTKTYEDGITDVKEDATTKADKALADAKTDTDGKLKSYSKTVEVKSLISQTAGEINIQVRKKAGKDEIISVINASTEGVKIRGNVIDLRGNVSITSLTQSALNEIKKYSSDAEENAKEYTLAQIANLPSQTDNLVKGYNFSQTDLNNYWNTSGTIARNQYDPEGGRNAIQLYANNGDCFVSARRDTNKVINTIGRYTVSVWLRASKSQTINISFNRVAINCAVTTTWKKFTFIRDVTSINSANQLLTIGGFGSISSGDGYIYIFKPEVTFGYTSEEIFNMLTNNGQTQGLVLVGGRLYLNGEYIRANTISSTAIKSKSITADKLSVTDLSAVSAKIGGWKLGSSYLQSTNSNTTLYSDGRIKIGLVTMQANGNAMTVKYGLHVYAGTSQFSDGTDSIKFFNLKHVTSGGHMVFASDGATVAYLSSSSKRYKDHIRDMTLDEAKGVLDIPVVWFKYKNDYLDPRDRLLGKALPGFYAENVYKVLPEAAQLDADGNIEDWNYRIMIPAMLKLIQEMYKRMEEKGI